MIVINISGCEDTGGASEGSGGSVTIVKKAASRLFAAFGQLSLIIAKADSFIIYVQKTKTPAIAGVNVSMIMHALPCRNASSENKHERFCVCPEQLHALF